MPQNLIERLRRFRSDYFPQHEGHFRDLVAHGQKPSILFIGCSDSRLVPHLLTGTGPGDLFLVRNVANLVPPYEETGRYHGTSAALEFAVNILEVRDIAFADVLDVLDQRTRQSGHEEKAARKP